MTSEFLPEASEEFFDALEAYELADEGLGLRFRVEVERMVRKIEANPMVWRERETGYRRVNLKKSPFFISYFTDGDKIVTAAVAHGHRHPNYWKNRLPKS